MRGSKALLGMVAGLLLAAVGPLSAQKAGGSTNGEGGGGGEAEWHCFTCANNACPQSEEMAWYIKDDTPPYGNFGNTYGGGSFCMVGNCPSPGTCVPLLAARTTSQDAVIYLAKANLRDTRALREMVASNASFRVNMSRGALQVLGCNGIGVVASVPLPRDVLLELSRSARTPSLGASPIRWRMSDT